MKWWRRLFRRRKLDEELERELSFHLDQHTSDLVEQGYSPEEARRRARIALGGPEQVKEMCRDARGTRWVNDLLRDLPVENPEELVAPYWGRKTDAHVWGEFSYPNYLDLRDQNKSFSDLCAWRETSAGISSGAGRDADDGGRAEIVWGELVSGNYFDVMGVKPIRGRVFLPEEDSTPNTHPVTVIGQVLWQRRFNSDLSI